VVLVSVRGCTTAALLALALAAHARAADETDQARRGWAKSPHGAMLERILPPAMTPRRLPEAPSEGARLTVRYCVQCHHLVNPAMHTAERWKSVVDRMVWRMRGNGNMGTLMKEMMAEVRTPSDAEVETLTAYLQKHAQATIDAKHPALATRAGDMFAIACSQCHALPDPRRHTAKEWPAVVERMKRHMAWTNVVVGSPELRTVPELKADEILALLQRYSK
jgi:cytochrome c2